jgi:hypothetical protein
MKVMTSLTVIAALIASTSLASAQVGVGQAVSGSSSSAGAVSVSRGGRGGQGGVGVGQGGSVRSSNTVNFNNGGRSAVENNTRYRSSGSLRTTSTAVAPQLVASAVGTCLGSAGIGIGATGWGFSAGTTIPDKNCDLRMFSEALLKTGQRVAATAILCRNAEAYLAMTSVGLRCPIVPDGYQVAAYQQPSVHPFQQQVVVTKASYAPAPTYDRVPVYVQPATSRRVEAPSRYSHEQQQASLAAKRLEGEYSAAKKACQARGDRVC